MLRCSNGAPGRDVERKTGCYRNLPLSVAAAIAISAAIYSPAFAASDSQPVTVIVPYPAGSTADLLPRVVTQMLTDKGGRSYIIDNKPGATQTIGIRAAAQAKPDGHTILFGSAGGLAIAPALRKVQPFDVLKDFVPITLSHTSPLYLITRRDLPVASVSDLITLARSNPGKLTYGTGGPGSIAHLSGELLKQQAGIDIVQVPYTGAGPALRDVAGGHIDITFTGSLLGLADQLKVLATTGQKRSKTLPAIPTMKESGLPDFQVASWFGFLAPAGTPKTAIDALAKDIAEVINSSEFRARLRAASTEFELETSTPEEFHALIVDQIPFWKGLVKAAKLPVTE